MKFLLILVIIPIIITATQALDQRLIDYYQIKPKCTIQNNTIKCPEPVLVNLVNETPQVYTNNYNKTFKISPSFLQKSKQLVAIKYTNDSYEYHTHKFNTKFTPVIKINDCKITNASKVIIKGKYNTIEINSNELKNTSLQLQNAEITGYWFTKNNLNFYADYHKNISYCFDKIQIKNPKYNNKLLIPIEITTNQTNLLKIKIKSNTEICYLETPIKGNKILEIECPYSKNYTIEYLDIEGKKEFYLTNIKLKTTNSNNEIKTKKTSQKPITLKLTEDKQNNQTQLKKIKTISKKIYYPNQTQKNSTIIKKKQKTKSKTISIISILIILIILLTITITRHKTKVH